MTKKRGGRWIRRAVAWFVAACLFLWWNRTPWKWRRVRLFERQTGLGCWRIARGEAHCRLGLTVPWEEVRAELQSHVDASKPAPARAGRRRAEK